MCFDQFLTFLEDIKMSFHEKNAWACLIAIVVVFVPYFLIVFQYPMAFVGWLVLAVIGLSVLLAVFHIVNALATRSIRQRGDTPAQDELDRLIELRAAKLSGIVLAVVVVVWSLSAMFGVPTIAGEGTASSQFAIPIMQVMIAIHLLFAGFVVANLAYYGSIVAGYRRLLHG
jgi:hypothetical protein